MKIPFFGQCSFELGLPRCAGVCTFVCPLVEVCHSRIASFFNIIYVGELFITHTWTCNERNHKCQTEGHPHPKLQATLTTWVEADTKGCKEATCQAKQAAHKAVVHQPTAKPVHFQETKHHLCLNRPNIAVKAHPSQVPYERAVQTCHCYDQRDDWQSLATKKVTQGMPHRFS